MGRLQLCCLRSQIVTSKREAERLDSLLSIPGFGQLGLEQFKFQLGKHNILDKNGHSDLYQYIVSDTAMDKI
jgi:hypothetical protein